MATQAQIDANRRNAQKSTGPKSRPGKDKTRFNGLKHGLRAEQVVLPGEDPAEFAAELKGWSDDWNPQSHTRAVLCRARRRRLVATPPIRPRRGRPAPRARRGRCRAVRRRAPRGDRRRRRPVRDRPARPSARLRSDVDGVDRLIAWWDVLDATLEEGPAAWDFGSHARLMVLLGHLPDADPAGRLGRCRWPRPGCSSPTTPGHSPGRRPARGRGGRGRDRRVPGAGRRHAPASCDGPASGSRTRPSSAERAIGAVRVDSSKEAVLLHRYEMAHDRSLRATLKDLMALAKSGADLVERPEEVTEPAVAADVVDVPTEANSSGGSGGRCADRSQFS